MVKKILLLPVLVLVLLQGMAAAQQKDPLAMRIVVDWTLAGAAAGVGIGAGVWLTDPGRPGNKLGEQSANGAAWGAVAGAIYSLLVMSETMIQPRFLSLRPDPLHPSQRIQADPIGDENNRQDLFTVSTTGSRRSGGFNFHVLNLKF